MNHKILFRVVISRTNTLLAMSFKARSVIDPELVNSSIGTQTKRDTYLWGVGTVFGDTNVVNS